MSEERLTVFIDGRCKDKSCARKGAYRMVGSCSNCHTKGILVMFTEGHETCLQRCPVCGCAEVRGYRLATENEIPAAVNA